MSKRKYETRTDDLLPKYLDDIKASFGLTLTRVLLPETDHEKEVKAALAGLLYSRLQNARNFSQVIDYLCERLGYSRADMIQILFNQDKERERFDRSVTIPEPPISDELAVSDFYLNHFFNPNR